VARTALFVLASVSALAAGSVVAGFERLPDPQAVAAAIGIGQSSLGQTRSTFHAPYRIAIGKAPIDYMDVVTPFRRVVLAAEARLRTGSRLLTQREANEILGANLEQVDILVELTLHPLNTYIGVPLYDLLLAPLGGTIPIRPRGIDLVPRHGPRLEGTPLTFPYPSSPQVPAGSQPLLGGTLIAKFDGTLLDAGGTYDLVIEDSGKELGRGRVDFRRLR
jgi:hypothetical protein